MQPFKYKVIYNDTDITEDISNDLISLSYTDKVSGESDELEITVQDKDGRWRTEWYPDISATLQAQIFLDKEILNCGTFQLDETEGSGSKSSGDVFTIKCLAAGIKDAVRTKKTYAHEKKTLREIANTVASQYGYSVKGNIPNVKVDRETQYRETDLAFLSRVAADYGLVFNVRNKILFFSSVYDLENAAAVLTFRKQDLISYNLKDKTADTYLQAQTAYYHPKSKRVIEFTNKDGRDVKFRRSFDYVEVRSRAENPQQAQMKAAAALHWANSLQQEGSITVDGNINLLAGNNIELTELGTAYSGIFHVMKSSHSGNRSDGYNTSAEIKRIALIEAEKEKQKEY